MRFRSDSSNSISPAMGRRQACGDRVGDGRMTDDLIDVVDRAGRSDPHYEELADRLRDAQVALAEELMAGTMS